MNMKYRGFCYRRLNFGEKDRVLNEIQDMLAPLLPTCHTCFWDHRSCLISVQMSMLILAHQAYYHLLPCPMNCLFVKYASSYDFRTKMTFKLPRPRTDIIKKSCQSYKSIIRWNALENQMRSICDIGAFKGHSRVLFSHIYCKCVEFLY